MTEPPGNPKTDAEHARLVQELQRRIDTLQQADESDFGEFTGTDWLLCVGGFVILPYLLFIWFWP